jgi:predicted DNA-binding transcriptional regulator
LGPLSQDILNGLDMKAACAVAGSERMRLLVGKLPELAEEGNRYGERFSKHELETILKEALMDELVLQKILLLLNGKGMSIRQISIKLDLPMPVVFRKVLTLNRAKLIKRSMIKGIAPIYTAVKTKPQESEGEVKKAESGGVTGA